MSMQQKYFFGIKFKENANFSKKSSFIHFLLKSKIAASIKLADFISLIFKKLVKS
jgi:transposase